MDKQDRAQAPSSKLSPECFVAVHIGAGHHSRKTEQQYKDGDLRIPQMTSSCQRYKMSRTPYLCPLLGSFEHHVTQTLIFLSCTVMKKACHKGEEAFRSQGTALGAVVAAITVLEVCFGISEHHQCLEQIWKPTRRTDAKQP